MSGVGPRSEGNLRGVGGGSSRFVFLIFRASTLVRLAQHLKTQHPQIRLMILTLKLHLLPHFLFL